LEGTYWEMSANKCEPIYDPFCKKGKKYGECDECISNYYVSPIYSPAIQFRIIKKGLLDKCTTP
jgi:hypothetical protein